MTDGDSAPPPSGQKVPTPQPAPAQKVAKPAKPRKVERRRKGRKS